MKLGIVSTHRRWTSDSEAWARYHLRLGFTRIYVFADDGCTHELPSNLAVDLTPCTPARWAAQSAAGWFSEKLSDIERDFGTPRWGSPRRVMNRQVLNATEALVQASKDGIDWLLHIDDDEYFWCPGAPVHDHFEALHRAGIGCVTYLNHEAVLLEEAAPACSTRRTSFKKHRNALTSAQHSALPGLLAGRPWFVSHSSGKSAARVTARTAPLNVHSFVVDDGALGMGISRIPAVLHQPYKNVRQFCEKHLSQGEFSLEQDFDGPAGPPGIYAQAQHLCRSKDTDGLRSLYSNTVTWSENEKDRLDAEGLLLTPELPLPIDTDWSG